MWRGEVGEVEKEVEEEEVEVVEEMSRRAAASAW